MTEQNRRPCPSHPDAGDVSWFPIEHVPTGRQGEVPLCLRCIQEGKK